VIFRRLARWMLSIPAPLSRTITGVEIMISIKRGETISLKAVPKLDDGTESTVEGLSWGTSDEKVISLQYIDKDGTGLFLAESVGTAEIYAEADADLSEGVAPLKSGLTVQVVEPQATGMQISVVCVSKEPPYDIKKKPSLDK